MQGFVFYLFYPLIYLISKSPFWILYRISDFCFFIIYSLVGYRKKVVIENLTNSFPQKSEKEIKKLTKEFYVYLCDLLLETVKTVTWTEKDVMKRVKMHNVEMLNELHAKGKSLVLVMGHLGNWEWAGPCFSLNCKHQLFVVYQPLSNPYFEKMFSGSRTKFNTKIIPRKNTLRSMVENRKTINATALIADQAPNPIKAALWINFLNQDTPVFNGPEKIASKFDTAVVYMNVKRTKRGYYEVIPTLITETPKEEEDTNITFTFNRLLEQDIIAQPATWLWSHRRWKHKRPV